MSPNVTTSIDTVKKLTDSYQYIQGAVLCLKSPPKTCPTEKPPEQTSSRLAWGLSRSPKNL